MRLVIGCEADAAAQLDPIFAALAPSFEAAPQTAGRKPSRSPAEQGDLRCSSSGAWHFVKMVHNGSNTG
ncbi:MAG TPA: hypothetical protein VLT33_01870 [Labilithrix sp.]|nr:hypothetical protein [Labilithrix sp.]